MPKERVTHEQLLLLILSRRKKTHSSAFPLQSGSDGTELLGAVSSSPGLKQVQVNWNSALTHEPEVYSMNLVSQLPALLARRHLGK